METTFHYARVSGDDLNVSRHCLASGWTLAATARHIGVLSRDLDMALWNSFGGDVSPPMEARWLGNRPPPDEDRGYE